MDFETRWEALSQGIVPLQVRVNFNQSSVPIMPYPGWAVEVRPVEHPEQYYFWDDLELKVIPKGMVKGIMRTWVHDGKYLTCDKNRTFAFEASSGTLLYVPLSIYLAHRPDALLATIPLGHCASTITPRGWCKTLRWR